MDDDEYCGVCKFFDRTAPGADSGACKRYPPTLIVLGFQQPALQGQMPTPVTTSHWPLVGDVKYCGEFRHLAQRKALTAGELRELDLSKIGVDETEGKA